jgi:hypothetical protein
MTQERVHAVRGIVRPAGVDGLKSIAMVPVNVLLHY